MGRSTVVWARDLVSFAIIAFTCCNAEKLNVICAVIGDAKLTSYYASMPAFDVAFEQAKLRYPLLLSEANQYIIHKHGNYTCPESGALMLSVAAEVWNLLSQLQGISVLINPGM